MKTIFFFIAFWLCTNAMHSQNITTPWTWMKGDNTIDQTGIYGAKGVSSINNKPGARNYSSTWRDSNGNFWLFGGMGYASDNSQGNLNDLWKYDPTTNIWTWMKGDETIDHYAHYGTKGIPNDQNNPGAILFCVSWMDANNDLWLFGGFGFTENNNGFLNALWKYNTTLNQWVWMNGQNDIDAPGIYGTKGITNSNNNPGARYGSQTWVDASGDLWLFGGYGYDVNAMGLLNDLWKYSPTTNSWTWVSGDSIINKIGRFGIKGYATPLNNPGAGYVGTSWKDNNGNFWLYGGYGYDETEEGSLNDLWKYNPISNEWTWINGDKTIESVADYGFKGVANANNKPGAKYICNSWLDSFGELYLFGGYGYDSANVGYLNDVWKYNAESNQWTWISGDNKVNQTAVYGTQGLPDLTNKSGARTGSVSWTDNTGNLWLFGGYGYDGNTSGFLNDLWKINGFHSLLPIHLLNFSGVLNNQTVQLKWEAVDEINFSHYSVERSFDGINFTSIGLVNKAGNTTNNYTFIDNEFKNYRSNNIYYRLQMVDIDQKFTFSKVLKFDQKQLSKDVNIYPNPVVNSFTISISQQQKEAVSISIYSSDGIMVKVQKETISSGRNNISINVSNLPAGSYWLTLKNAASIISKQFIKQ